MTSLTRDDMFRCAHQLAQSEKGRATLQALRDWFDDGGLSLDEKNKTAAVTLIVGAFGSFPGSVRDAIAEQLTVCCPSR